MNVKTIGQLVVLGKFIMLRFIGALYNKLFGYEENEGDDCTEALEKRYELLKKQEEKETTQLEKEIKDACEEEQEKEPVSLDDYLCQYRIGVLSKLFLDYGLIDGKFRFELTGANVQGLKCGLLVRYVVFRNNIREDWRLSRVLSFEEAWDEDSAGPRNRFAVTKYVSTTERIEIGRVGRVKDRMVIVEHAGDYTRIDFCLDNISSPFTPMRGDWLRVDVLVEEDQLVQDLAGEILCVRSILPLRRKIFTGYVTEWNGSKLRGTIDTNVRFAMNACQEGYEPGVGDHVIVEAVESTFNQYLWRAINVARFNKEEESDDQAPAGNHSENDLISVEAQDCVTGSRGCGQNSKIPTRSERRDEHHDIIITDNLDFGTIERGARKTLRVEIWNRGARQHLLLRGRFLGKKCDSQLKVSGLDDDTPIHPGQKVIFSFECIGKFAGFSEERYSFRFRGFIIIRYLTVEVVDPLVMRNMPTNRQQTRGKYRRDSAACEKMLKENNEVIIPGVPALRSPPFVPVRFRQYLVPEAMREIVLGKEDFARKIKSLENLYLPLMDVLDICNYCEYFHVLLQLEEIAQSIELERYDMEHVMFTFAGPQYEYLALEVPGLTEKRPSVMVGDRLVARDPSKPGFKYEGYVHKVCSTTVWLKFSAEFHINYNGGALSVSFLYGRTQMRRLHTAVEMAVERLGEHFLFPDKLKLQKPQVSIRDRSGAEANDCGEDVGSCSRSSFHQQDLSNHDKSKRMQFAIPGVRPPSAPKISNKPVTIHWFNTALNDYQKLAVTNVLRGESRPLPYVIFGPPGTGKTITLVETILQIYHLIPDSRIMVASPSNSSANLLAERLLAYSVLRPGDLVRVVSHYLLDGDDMLPESLRPYSTTVDMNDPESREFPRIQRKLRPSSNATVIGRHRITVGTCACLGQLISVGFPRGHFTHLCVDEAGQATEPEIMIPLGFLDQSWGQAILAGDPEQLGPVLFSSLAKRFGLGESFLARLLKRQLYHRDTVAFPKHDGYNPYLITRLVMNYRSLPEILALPSSLFYQNRLQPQVTENDSREAALLKSLHSVLPERETSLPPALVFHGVRGYDLQEDDSPSWFNPQEIGQVIYYLAELLNLGVNIEDIGVITPYQKQVKKLRLMLNLAHIPIPKIGSVEEFQGQERMVIILSTVRSSEKYLQKDAQTALGFVACRERLNVAITRARALLIIVGNPHLLSKDVFWRHTLLYSIENGAYTGCDLPEIFQNRDQENC